MRFRLLKSDGLYYFLTSNGRYMILHKNDAKDQLLNYDQIAAEPFDGAESYMEFEGELIASLDINSCLIIHAPKLFRELMASDEISFPYYSLTEFAEKHSRTDSNVRKHCRAGRIPGAILIGSMWFIPKDADYPDDNRAGRVMPKRKKQ